MGNKQAKKPSDAASTRLIDPSKSGAAVPGQASLTHFDQYAFPFENAVFEGGVRNLLPYVGAVRLLEEAGIWRNIIRLAGSGSASVIATLLSLGYNSHQLETFLQDDLRILTEDHSCGTCCLGYSLTSNYGWSPNKKIIRWLSEKIQASAGQKDISFLEAYEKFGKDLCIVVTNVTQGRVEYLHRKTTPNLNIISAVRMSIATPGLVGPLQCTLYQDGVQVFADGGILCNYPIHCYDGWWLSTKPEDSFFTKVTSLEDQPAILDSRFAKFNSKTLGFVVYDDTPSDSWTAKLDARNKLGDKVVYPTTFLSNTYMYDNRDSRGKTQKEYTQYVSAANKFLNALADRVPEVNKLTATSELDAILSKNTSDEVKIIFGAKISAGDICKLIAPTRKGQFSRQDLMNYFERRAFGLDAKYRTQLTVKIVNFKDYLEAVNVAEAVHSRKQQVTAEDLDRTVGINIRYFTGLRNEKFEPADYAFLIEQGKISTKAFLEHFVSRGATPIKDSPNRRSFCRDDLPSFIDDDVSEIIDEKDYMENLIGRVL